MAAIITEKFRILNALSFKDSISSGAFKYYLGIARHTPWTEDDGVDVTEDNPPFPNASDQDIANIWRQMMGAKKVDSTRVSLSIPRYDWAENIKFAQYDVRDESLYRKPFYCVTPTLEVYKCIWNNNNGSTGTAAAGNIPNNTTGNIFSTPDGYKWVYMYTISPVDAASFITPQFIPVPATPDVLKPTNGTISSIFIDNGGSGYITPPAVDIIGNGTSTATAVATLTTASVSDIDVTAAGSGYTWADVSITGGGGSGAKAHANVAPFGGHGYFPAEELGGFYVTINTRLEYAESGAFTVANDYRQIVLIRDPNIFNTTTPFTATTADQRWKLTLTSAPTGSNPVKDSLITASPSGATARVVEYNAATLSVYVTDVSGTFNIADTITAGTMSATISAVTQPQMEPYSGTIDYVENRVSINRAPDQVEEIRITIEW